MDSVYGIVRPAIVNVNKDVDIYYQYRPSRTTTDDSYKDFIKVENPSTMLSCATVGSEDALVTGETNLSGMFNLSLPVSIFSRVGYYTILIRPREYKFTITDIGALGAYPDIRGVVIDTTTDEVVKTTSIDNSFFGNNNLIGYRIEYFSTTGTVMQRQAYTRIITSNNACTVMTQNLTNSNMSSKAYRFSDAGTLQFLTVTPSTSPSFNASSEPYIGAAGQTISISNSLFDATCVEVEICEHDIESLWTSLNGDTIRSFDSGLVTVYKDRKADGTEREIHTQHEFATIKDTYNHSEIMETKKQCIDNITYVDYSVFDED